MTFDISEIRNRVEAATPGPWRLETDYCAHGEYPHALVLPVHTATYDAKPCDPDDSTDAYRHKVSEISELTMDTAEFLAHSRDDVLELLAEVERLGREVETVRSVAQSNKGHYARSVVLLDRVESLIKDTDGGELGDGENVPASEIRRALCEPVRTTSGSSLEGGSA